MRELDACLDADVFDVNHPLKVEAIAKFSIQGSDHTRRGGVRGIHTGFRRLACSARRYATLQLSGYVSTRGDTATENCHDDIVRRRKKRGSDQSKTLISTLAG